MQTHTNMEERKAELIQRRTEEILAAAESIFAQYGYRLTKIDQIADSLNVGKGTIYRYFKDKKSLFIAVFEQGIRHLQQTMRSKTEQAPDPAKRVAAAVRTYFEFFEKNRELIEIEMQVRSEFRDEHKRVALTLYKDYMTRIQNNLREGIEKRIFRPMDVEKTAEAMSATLQGVLMGFYFRKLAAGADALESEKHVAIASDDVKYIAADNGSSQKSDLLTDRIGAVTDLLLRGLLKGGSDENIS
jgi:AcrR family transcriptional regulator